MSGPTGNAAGCCSARILRPLLLLRGGGVLSADIKYRVRQDEVVFHPYSAVSGFRTQCTIYKLGYVWMLQFACFGFDTIA